MQEHKPQTQEGRPGRTRRGPWFWLLAPFLIIFMAVILWVDKDRPVALILLVGLELLALLMLLGLFDPFRFAWAWRGVGGLVFLGFLAYFVSMLLEGGNAIRLPRRRAEANAFNALLGLIVFGLPGLCYALFGRLSWRQPSTADEELTDDDH